MIVNGNGGKPRENNALLSEMVQREFEVLTFKKERYDLNNPEHVKGAHKVGDTADRTGEGHGRDLCPALLPGRMPQLRRLPRKSG